MRLNSFISVVGLGLLGSASLAFSQENPVEALQRLYDQRRVAFSEAADELAYVKALTAIKSQLDSSTTTLAEEVTATQGAMMSYLVANSIFGFKIAEDPVSVNLVGSASVVARIKGVIIGAGVTGRVRPSEMNEREFNRLRGHFVGLLAQLKQKDPGNITLKAAVEWGCSTKVASRNTGSFGEEIIEFRTCQQLK